MIRKIIFIALLVIFQGDTFNQNKFHNYLVRPSKSGYYIFFEVDKDYSEDGTISIELNQGIIKEFSMKNKNTCEFNINRNTGLLSYDGYKDLDIYYIDQFNEHFTDSLSVLGYNDEAIEISNNSIDIDYIYHQGSSLYTDCISIFDNDICILPQDISTYVNRIFYIDCEDALFPYFSYKLVIENYDYELNLTYDWSEEMYCLNCPFLLVNNNPGLIEGDLVINYNQYFNFVLSFNENFLVKNMFSSESNPGYLIEFGESHA